MQQTYDWTFPLLRTHAGMLLGNGVAGVMVWGGGNQLNLTVNRAEFWDRRGAKQWTSAMNFNDIRKLLEAGDEDGLRGIFTKKNDPGLLPGSTMLPMGRFELVMVDGAKIKTGRLDLATGQITLSMDDAQGHKHLINLNLSMSAPVLHVAGTSLVKEVRRVTSWDYVGEALKAGSYAPPTLIDRPDITGWALCPPADPALAAVCRKDGDALWIALEYGSDADSAIDHSIQTIDRIRRDGADNLQAKNKLWWDEYWNDVPRVQLQNEKLAFLYHYGMYKFAGLTYPQGVAAGLQGAWVEEYQMPPWAADYHFNINVQMCYQPAYQGNRLSHLKPLFDLVWSWRDKLAENARLFVGIDDGLLLPHAVNDRAGIIGSFWTGTIDHACTAWVAKMMFDYWLYGGDEEFLRTRAYPFMQGAMRVYEEMLDREGGRFVLPVSVSPEYRGAAMNAWGRNASFQLAAIHWLAEALLAASRILGEPERPVWREIQQKLPKASTETKNGKTQIMLWEGTPLEESHRHHSHLGGIYPFDVIDPLDPAWQPIVKDSINHWIYQGMGLWSGWCMPWAATLHAHTGNRDMPELVLDIWQKVFTNEGHGTLHDCMIRGFTLMGAGASAASGKNNEIMQMDAGMGTVGAILDLLVHCRRGVTHVFAGIPASWPNAAFERVRIEGAFLVSSEIASGDVSHVTVHSDRGGKFRLANPWTTSAIVDRNGRQERLDGAVLEVTMNSGESLRVTRS